MSIKASVLIPIAALSFSFVNPCSEKTPPRVKKPASGEAVLDVEVVFPRFISAPRRAQVEGEIGPSDVNFVNAAADGVVERVLVAVGDKVEAGDPVVNIASADLTDEIDLLRDKAQEAAARLKDAKNKLSVTPNPDRNVTDDEVLFLDEEPSPSPSKTYGSPEREQPPQTLKDLAEVLQSMVDRYNGRADALEKKLLELTHKSPVSGVVMDRFFNDGNRVKVQDKLLAIATTDPVSVTFKLSADIASFVDKHSSATVSVGDASDASGDGLVYFISPDIDPATQSIEVRAHVSNPEGLLKGGQKADVRVTTTKSDRVLVVPPQAVVYDGEREFLFVVYGNQVSLTEVRTGKKLPDGSVEVPGVDVRVDDPIVINRPLELKNNSFVNIAKEIAFDPQTVEDGGSAGRAGLE